MFELVKCVISLVADTLNQGGIRYYQGEERELIVVANRVEADQQVGVGADFAKTWKDQSRSSSWAREDRENKQNRSSS